MDISGIPKSFWHSVSFSIVAVTMGLLYLGWHAQNVRLEFSNTKLELNSAVSEVEEINRELQREYERLELLSRGGELREQLQREQSQLQDTDSEALEQFVMPQERLQDVEERLKGVRDVITKE